MEPISIARSEKNNSITLKITGTLNRTACEPLLSQIRLLQGSSQKSLVLDLSDLCQISGEGMMLLANFCTQATSGGCEVRVEGLNEKQLEIFRLTKMSTIVQTAAHNNPAVQSTGYWASPVRRVDCIHPPTKATNLNVHGRELTSPLQGFGRLWLRTYRVGLPGDVIQPDRLMSHWKAKFSSFWPPGNAIYMPEDGITPGAVGLINLAMPLGLNLATGAAVIYENDTSFTLMTVQGHMFSGFINFCSYSEDGLTFAQTQALVRPNDLLYELSFRVGFGSKAEDAFWVQTLKNLAQALEAEYSPDGGKNQHVIDVTSELIDGRIHWRHFPNIWYNAGVRSGVYQFFKPFRKLFSEK